MYVDPRRELKADELNHLLAELGWQAADIPCAGREHQDRATGRRILVRREYQGQIVAYDVTGLTGG